MANGVAYGCKTVCRSPSGIEIAAGLCEGTATGLCVVVDFPFGLSATASHLTRTKEVLRTGVQEIDIVANYGWLRGGWADLVEQNLRAVIDECHASGVPAKVILETDALTIDEVRTGTEAAIAARRGLSRSPLGSSPVRCGTRGWSLLRGGFFVEHEPSFGQVFMGG